MGTVTKGKAARLSVEAGCSELREVIVRPMCATACFDIGYEVSDMNYAMIKVIQLRRNVKAFYLQ